jgi:hypothetical protein
VTALLRFLRILLVAFLPALAHAADAGVYTIVESDVRVMRATTWYRLAAGARVQDGDIIELGERAQLQLEIEGGIRVNLQGPALAHATVVPAAGVELTVQRAWLKAVASGKRPLRLRLPNAIVDVADGIVVARADAGEAALFVEAGTMRVTTPAPRGKEPPPRAAGAGEFVARQGDRALLPASRPPAAFVTAMPVQFRDQLPAFADRYREAPTLAAGSEVTLAEAEPWLAGPARRAFVRRFTPRLRDPAFRGGVLARPAAFPEWDRMLNPEKYRPKATGDAAGGDVRGAPKAAGGAP